jgi:hypothetical protein
MFRRLVPIERHSRRFSSRENNSIKTVQFSRSSDLTIRGKLGVARNPFLIVETLTSGVGRNSNIPEQSYIPQPQDIAGVPQTHPGSARTPMSGCSSFDISITDFGMGLPKKFLRFLTPRHNPCHDAEKCRANCAQQLLGR